MVLFAPSSAGSIKATERAGYSLAAGLAFRLAESVQAKASSTMAVDLNWRSSRRLAPLLKSSVLLLSLAFNSTSPPKATDTVSCPFMSRL
jgi:hypothetical protein